MPAPRRELRVLVSLDAKKLARVSDVLHTKLPCPRGDLVEAFDKVGVDGSAIAKLVEHYLSRGTPGGEFSGKLLEVLKKDVVAAIDDEGGAFFEGNETILTKIFSEANAIAVKGASLQERILPHLAAFRSLVDLRAVFDEPHKRVLAFVPAIVMELGLHTSQHDPVTSTFQLTPGELDSMIETLTDAKRKLEEITKTAKSAGLTVLA